MAPLAALSVFPITFGTRHDGGGGTIVAIVQVFVAGVWSTFPAASLARTAKVCVPSASPEKLVGEVQAAKAAESSEQAKLELASLDVKVKLALEELGSGAPEAIVVSGGIVSTRQA